MSGILRVRGSEPERRVYDVYLEEGPHGVDVMINGYVVLRLTPEGFIRFPSVDPDEVPFPLDYEDRIQEVEE